MLLVIVIYGIAVITVAVSPSPGSVDAKPEDQCQGELLSPAKVLHSGRRSVPWVASKAPWERRNAEHRLPLSDHVIGVFPFPIRCRHYLLLLTSARSDHLTHDCVLRTGARGFTEFITISNSSSSSYPPLFLFPMYPAN